MVRSFVFTEGKLVERDIDLSFIPMLLKDDGVHVWIDLENPTPEESARILEKIFQFHPLAIEDCLIPSPLPKIEEYEGYLFVVIHAVGFNRKAEHFQTTELDFFLGKNYLVTWHSEPLHCIQATLDRCAKTSMTARGSDRIAHSILDTLIDYYLPVLYEFGEDLNDLESSMVQTHFEKAPMNRIMELKKEVVHLCQILRPQREVLDRFARGEFKIVRPALLPYYRDVCSHLAHYEEMAESYRDSLNSAIQLYLSVSSNRTSEIVKVLTLITVVTTPAMIVGSWYGMNFRHMPELDSPWGYFGVLILTLVTTLWTLIYFKRKKWM
ncbi:MAG: magnesium/cobalt transporter CorA [Verrucomicrobiae bacterium]|nr:magnesium/cobalt transporter CorA [Verrucomicrobiae bacterium]